MKRTEFIERCHKRFNCPSCGKELVRLEPWDRGKYIFWCDDCKIDFEITDDLDEED